MILAELPIRLESVANLREHWRKSSKRTKAHRAAAIAVPVHSIKLPCKFRLTRVAPRKLDCHDNLRVSAKALVDGLCDRLGIKDNDPRVSFEYAQQKRGVREYAVIVEAI